MWWFTQQLNSSLVMAQLLWVRLLTLESLITPDIQIDLRALTSQILPTMVWFTLKHLALALHLVQISLIYLRFA